MSGAAQMRHETWIESPSAGYDGSRSWRAECECGWKSAASAYKWRARAACMEHEEKNA